MERICTKEDVQNAIKNNQLCVVYFTGSDCGACEVIKHKVEVMLENYPQVKGIEINGAQHPDVAANYDVYTLPIMILFVEGKESIREGKHLDLLAFEGTLQRYIDMIEDIRK